MDTTTALTGMLPAVIITASIFTFIASAILLWLYRRATIKGMNQRATPEGNSHPQSAHAAESGAETKLEISILRDDTDTEVTPLAQGRYQQAQRASQKAAIVYSLGGLVYALIIATTWMHLAGGFSLGRFAWLLAVYLWPTVIALGLMVAVSRREILLFAFVYAILVFLAGCFVVLRNDQSSIGQLVFFWLYANFATSVLFVAFLQQRIRSVGPLVFTFMLAGVTGAFVLIQYLGGNDALLYWVSSAGFALGLGASPIFWLVNLAGFLLFSVIGWFVLKSIGKNYQLKRSSDQSITLDALWLMFGIVQSITLTFEGVAWILVGPLAFAGYKLVSSIGLRMAAGSATKPQYPARLLLLRVFALGRISNLWFYRFTKLWRHAGSVNMIAGPDLVTLAVEPHEFLTFLGGDLSRQFVKDSPDLEARLSKLDTQPDFDWRYRVNEFFCHDDTWRMTLQRLATDSESVLMDLRSFSESNKGCLYELQVLMNSVDLRKVVFLVDDTTDTPFLEQSLKTLSQGIDPDSPNVSQQPACARFFHSNNPSRQSIRKMMLILLASHSNQKTGSPNAAASSNQRFQRSWLSLLPRRL